LTRHYLDHASTSPMRPAARRAVADWLAGGTEADPARAHLEGRTARHPIETAREQVAALFGARPREVVFTSGATEAIVAAVFGATRARPGASVVCAGVEHSAVREGSARWAPVAELRVDPAGSVDLDHLDETLARLADVALVHCQWGNHEVGTVQPVAEVVARSHRRGVPVHVDAAAAAGHVPVDFHGCGADLCSVSAHKLGGPPGAGALLVRRGLRLEPLLVGGAQERARRAGLENTPGIVGFGAAAAELASDGRLGEEQERAARQSAAVTASLQGVAGVELLGSRDGDRRLPHVVCASVGGVESEAVLLGLDQAGIAVHSGSACSSEALEPSPVLAAMGVEADRSLRISVGWNTTDDDVSAFAEAFPEVVSRLRALGGSA
jgi:cysteine desulfurase